MTEQERQQENETRRRERLAFREGMDFQADVECVMGADCAACAAHIRERYPYIKDRQLREYRGCRWNPETRRIERYDLMTGFWGYSMFQDVSNYTPDVRAFLRDAQEHPYEEIAE